MSARLAALVLAGAVALPAAAQAPASEPGPYWLAPYPEVGFAAIWRVSLKVKDVTKAAEKAVKAVEKQGGQTLVPEPNQIVSKTSAYRQLSYRIPAAKAEKVLAAVKKLGEPEATVQNPMLDPGAAESVARKLKELRAEAGAKSLDGAPIHAALGRELIARLEAVEKSYREARERVLLNIEFRGEPAPGKTR